MIRASVAMAAYNGERYIKEQIETILASMSSQDELVISDDGSTDATREIVQEMMHQDKRIRLIDGPKQGVKKNFENAMLACQGTYIFLADQDDIWDKEKLEGVLAAFEEQKCKVVVHDAVVVAEDGREILWDSFFAWRNSGAGALKNIWKNTYIGCCMAFKRELLERVVPVPNSIEMHDQWIGVINDLQKGGTYFLPEKYLRYRRHGENASSMKHYGIVKMITNRFIFLWELLKRFLFRKK